MCALVASAVCAAVGAVCGPAAASPRSGDLGRPAHQARPVSGVAFGLQPATQGRPDTRTRYSYSATPGAVFDDQVAVVNIGSKPVSVAIYATDATSGKDGSFALLPTATKPTQLGTWVSLRSNGHVTVPARTKRGPSFVVVPFRLSIPQAATPGDHAGGIVVSLQGSAVNKQGVRVELDQRVGMRIYTRISGPLHPALSVDKVRLSYAAPSAFGNPLGDGTATVHYRVRNTGNVLLGATEHGSVSSWLGGSTSLGRLPAVPPLLPGASVELTATARGVFPGLRLTAGVTVHPYAPAGASVPHLSDATGTDALWALPWGLVVLALIVVLAAVLAVYRLRHSRRSVGAHSRSSRRRRASLTTAPEGSS